MLSPFIRTKSKEQIEPKVVIVHDNSQSLNTSWTAEGKENYLAQLNDLKQSFAGEYQTEQYTFGNELKIGDTLSFDDKKTNMADALEQLSGLYFNQNVGAVILASDGIFNEGMSPYYTSFDFPIYSIALGDTTSKKDVRIANVRHNRIAYLGDKVQVQIDVEAINCIGDEATVKLFRIGKNSSSILASKTIRFDEQYEELMIEELVQANSVGVQHYRVTVSELGNETTTRNNVRDFYIDVLDSRQKVLIIADAPHPDISAIKNVVESNKNFELQIAYAKDFNKRISDYNLIILHSLPSKTNLASNIFSRIKTEQVPTWFIAGTSTNFAQLNSVQNAVKVIAIN